MATARCGGSACTITHDFDFIFKVLVARLSSAYSPSQFVRSKCHLIDLCRKVRFFSGRKWSRRKCSDMRMSIRCVHIITDYVNGSCGRQIFLWQYLSTPFLWCFSFRLLLLCYLWFIFWTAAFGGVRCGMSVCDVQLCVCNVLPNVQNF